MKIGLIISTHTHPELLQRAIDSVYHMPFDEIVVVDDVAPDKSFIKTIPCKYTKIKLIVNSECRGLAEVRNQGIANCSCDWVTFLDDDDFYFRNPLDKLHSFIANNKNADIIHFPIKNKQLNQKLVLWGNKSFTLLELLKSNRLAGCSLLKKDVWRKLNGFKNIPYEDWEFWIRAKKQGYIFKYFDSAFYFRETHLDGLETSTRTAISTEDWKKKYISEYL